MRRISDPVAPRARAGWRRTAGARVNPPRGRARVIGRLLPAGARPAAGTPRAPGDAAAAVAGDRAAGYPYVPGTASDPIRSSVLYFGGILAVGTTTGKLFFLDRNNGTTGPALVREYYFGPTQSVSGIAYDGNASRYMVSTADPATKDG